VQIDLGNDLVRVSVEDNGKGFDPETLKESTNLGLKLIRERAEMLGGSFEIDSASGSGARISFSVPSKV
jgi:signal transduction histidine kinase